MFASLVPVSAPERLSRTVQPTSNTNTITPAVQAAAPSSANGTSVSRTGAIPIATVPSAVNGNWPTGACQWRSSRAKYDGIRE